jgi:hypothetical protein
VFQVMAEFRLFSAFFTETLEIPHSPLKSIFSLIQACGLCMYSVYKHISMVQKIYMYIKLC